MGPDCPKGSFRITETPGLQGFTLGSDSLRSDTPVGFPTESKTRTLASHRGLRVRTSHPGPGGRTLTRPRRWTSPGRDPRPLRSSPRLSGSRLRHSSRSEGIRSVSPSSNRSVSELEKVVVFGVPLCPRPSLLSVPSPLVLSSSQFFCAGVGSGRKGKEVRTR